MAPQALSVVIITKNEEATIGPCLRSVAWAEERIVVDCGSTDRTVRTATELGARVVHRAWSGYTEQKNHGVGQATHDWILSLDADERLSEEAARDVREALAAPRHDGYRIRRRTGFCGAYPDRAWGRDRPPRLFRKSRGRFAGGPVHEAVRLEPGSTRGSLSGPILHLGYRSIHDYVERMNRYTDLAAEGLASRGTGFRPGRMVFGPPWAWIRSYVLGLGCLDGTRGFILAAGRAYYVLVREAKLWERRVQR